MYYAILSTKYARRLETDLLEGRRATPDLSKRHAAAAGAHVHKNRHTIKHESQSQSTACSETLQKAIFLRLGLLAFLATLQVE